MEKTTYAADLTYPVVTKPKKYSNKMVTSHFSALISTNDLCAISALDASLSTRANERAYQVRDLAYHARHAWKF